MTVGFLRTCYVPTNRLNFQVSHTLTETDLRPHCTKKFNLPLLTKDEIKKVESVGLLMKGITCLIGCFVLVERLVNMPRSTFECSCEMKRPYHLRL